MLSKLHAGKRTICKVWAQGPQNYHSQSFLPPPGHSLLLPRQARHIPVPHPWVSPQGTLSTHRLPLTAPTPRACPFHGHAASPCSVDPRSCTCSPATVHMGCVRFGQELVQSLHTLLGGHALSPCPGQTPGSRTAGTPGVRTTSCGGAGTHYTRPDHSCSCQQFANPNSSIRVGGGNCLSLRAGGSVTPQSQLVFPGGRTVQCVFCLC